MKVTYTTILARKILLAFLAFIIILSIATFFVRNTITQKLESISKLANNVEKDQSKPQRALLLLHESENDFQESLLNTDSTKKARYKSKLLQAFNEIDTLVKENSDTAHLTAAQKGKVKLWYLKKLNLSNKLYALKHNFDSLLTAYAEFSKEADLSLKTTTNTSSRSTINSTDTIQRSGNRAKRGLLRRLKDAILNKESEPSAVVKHTDNKTVTELTRQILDKDKKTYSQKMRELQQRNISLLSKQKELIVLNNNISSELERIIYDAKEINYNMTDEFKRMALRTYQETIAIWNSFFLVALIIILVFAILLILFILQLNRSEQFLRKENERSVAMAQQKMDLLHHMTHEIRNPLTAIKGFLYIFSRSSLSQRQMDMLDSIRLSSDMLLRTLNDTLDAAKMETSEFRINSDLFNPDFTLKMAVESMEFSASKKKLAITYNFTGNKEALVLGDSFRLNQIMVNLLSNAIKYTGKGGITINAELSEKNSLRVDIIDTGDGISLEQQTNLFSKYYQTNSSKGKMGTGLGLFICKQLVEMQGGKITVKSSPDAGSTFSFFIPYAPGDNNSVAKLGVNDPLLLINGISILVIDDDELSLMFLKMMMSTWNVKFYQASNGKEALDIILNNAITVIITDIQMPEMDGYTLFETIKKQKAPLCNLPVIAISSTSEQITGEKLLQMGFSGFVGKPFTEADLLKQLVKVLK